MDDDRITNRALVRFQIISAYLAADPPRGKRTKLLQELAAKQWVLEDGKVWSVQPETIRYWVRMYRRAGFEALKDSPRKDSGVSKALPTDLVEQACQLKKEVPERSVERIIAIMEDMGKAPKGLLRRSTVHRALKARGLSARRPTPARDRDLARFQADYANDLWQADMLVGPWLPDPERPGKHRRAYLYAFLDDASRLLLYGRFSFKGDLPALELVFKRSIQRYGLPRRVYYDNAYVFRSKKMHRICAELGIHRILFTTPYRPLGHGKIEAFNRQCRSRFLAELKASSIDTLDGLNEAFVAWIDEDYNRRKHSELGTTPHERWLRDGERAQYVDEEKLRRAFLFKVDRTPDACGVLSLHNRRYQASWELARKKVQVHYDPEHLDTVELFRDGRFVERARELVVTAHRPPRRAAPALEPKSKNEATDYLEHLVKRRRAALPPSTPELVPDPTGEFVALVRAHLAPEVFDEARVRDFFARFGPFALDRIEQILENLLATEPDTCHIDFYLDHIRHKEARS